MPIFPTIAANIDEAVIGVINFNNAIKHLSRSHAVVRAIPYVRAWYGVRMPDENFVFGPSKFIGYAGNTPELYADFNTRGMDGRTTERVLRTWGDCIDPDNPIYDEMMHTLTSFCAELGFAPNKKSRLRLLSRNSIGAIP